MTPGVELDKVTAFLREIMELETIAFNSRWEIDGAFAELGDFMRLAMEAYDEHHALLAGCRALTARIHQMERDSAIAEWAAAEERELEDYK